MKKALTFAIVAVIFTARFVFAGDFVFSRGKTVVWQTPEMFVSDCHLRSVLLVVSDSSFQDGGNRQTTSNGFFFDQTVDACNNFAIVRYSFSSFELFPNDLRFKGSNAGLHLTILVTDHDSSTHNLVIDLDWLGTNTFETARGQFEFPDGSIQKYKRSHIETRTVGTLVLKGEDLNLLPATSSIETGFFKIPADFGG